MLLFFHKMFHFSCVSNQGFKPVEEALHSLLPRQDKITHFTNRPSPLQTCYRHLTSATPSYCAHSFKNLSTRTSDLGNLHIIFLALPQSIILTFYIFNPSCSSCSAKSPRYALFFLLKLVISEHVPDYYLTSRKSTRCSGKLQYKK